MTRVRRAFPAIIALLLLIAAALVIVGATLEKGATAEHSEVAEHSESTEHPESAEPALAGILESPVSLGGMAAVSLIVAVAVWRRPTRPVLAVVILFTIGAAVFDSLEIQSKTNGESALLALVIAILGIRAATLALAMSSMTQPTSD